MPEQKAMSEATTSAIDAFDIPGQWCYDGGTVGARRYAKADSGYPACRPFAYLVPAGSQRRQALPFAEVAMDGWQKLAERGDGLGAVYAYVVEHPGIGLHQTATDVAAYMWCVGQYFGPDSAAYLVSVLEARGRLTVKLEAK